MTRRHADPDGILGPKGLNLLSLALTINDSLNFFRALLPGITSVVLSPDGKSLDVVYGAFGVPPGLKITSSVSDKEGNPAFDAHMSP